MTELGQALREVSMVDLLTRLSMSSHIAANGSGTTADRAAIRTVAYAEELLRRRREAAVEIAEAVLP